MNLEIVNRKGARKAQDIPTEVLHLLNRGEIETVNLTEWLNVDHSEIIKNNFPEIGISNTDINTLLEAIKDQKKPTTMSNTKLVGLNIYNLYAENSNFNSIVTKLSNHPSDSIRCFAPYLIALNEKLNTEQKLNNAQNLIADKHFGVREVVWMALRPAIENDLKNAVDILSKWTKSKDENIRRFTTEATRPRGVWCKHIDTLKENPEIALPILDNLKADSSKYVQDSVGNWLNDASKTKPEFVINLCNNWQKDSPIKETEKIIKRARRTIDKK